MKQAVLQHMHTAMSLARAGKPELVLALCVTDHETGRTLRELPLELHRHAIKQMQLSEQQRHRLADVIAVFSELMRAVATQEAHLVKPEPSSSSGSSSGSDRDPGCNDGADVRSSSSIPAVQSRSKLQRATQLWAGAQLVQRKEYMLRMIGGAFVCASLNWVQMAQLVVFCSPYAPSTINFAELVAEEVAAQQQQQQQQ
ncbi:hypothetical protein OEZ86_012615 [Tetradesmus obliquus]|nr:hypothetical protein OEZ86_012615 [Tetradesmus obliquus]